MREHMGLYRGKRLDNCEWIEGNLIRLPHGIAILANGYANVVPYTVGECTGLEDKDGKLIFEGDILKGMRGLHRVYYDTSLACFEWARINGNWEESFSGFADEYEIIGNIYDNPELLESEG